MRPKCIRCNTDLIVGENVTQYQINHSQYVCRACSTNYQRNRPRSDAQREYKRNWQKGYRHRTGINMPLNENRMCSSFLGVHVAEGVLSHVFKDVERMPIQNPGYDFICNKGMKIDVKSSCKRPMTGSWCFDIRRNIIADYFLCLAFDNREELKPLHIWLIPGGIVNHLSGAMIAVSTLDKWDDYRLDISRVSQCCEVFKEVEL